MRWVTRQAVSGRPYEEEKTSVAEQKGRVVAAAAAAEAEVG